MLQNIFFHFYIEITNGFELRLEDTSIQCAEFQTKNYTSDEYLCFNIRFSNHSITMERYYRPLFILYGQNKRTQLDIELGDEIVINDLLYITFKLILGVRVYDKFKFHLYVRVGKIQSKLACEYWPAKWKRICLNISSSEKVRPGL